jgi:hypothetical protein
MKKTLQLVTLVAAISACFLSVSCSSSSTEDVPIKTGTDTLPQAPGQGDAPGVMDPKTGQPAGAPGTSGALTMPGNKGGK